MTASLVEALGGAAGVVAAELRPPRAELAGADGIDAWIDTYHAVHRLSRNGTRVFLTDSAVGTEEEDNLRHLMANIGTDVPRDRIVPFLTAKHPIEYCLSYAERAAQAGFPALVVLGGDRSVGVPRCVEHAWQLRQLIRARVPDLALGGWANPNAEPTAQAPLSDRDSLHGGVLSHPDRVTPHAGGGRALSGRGPAGRRRRAGYVWRVLLPQREPEDACGTGAVPSGADGRTSRGVRGRRHAAGRVRANDPGTPLDRRAACLHQQPAARPGKSNADRRTLRW